MKIILDGLTSVVLAGGYQTRFANGIPKLTAPIGGRLFVDYLADSMKDISLKRMVFLSGYQDMPDKKSEWRGMETIYHSEWPPSGTAGALRNMPYGFSDSFFVINGDTVSLGLNHKNMLAIHNSTLSFVTIAKDANGKSCGTYIFSPEAISMIPPETKSLEHECFPTWNAAMKKITTVFCGVRIVDIGTPEGYAEACGVLPQYYESGVTP